MPAPLPGSLRTLSAGLRPFVRHPWVALGIAALGTLLSALGPLLQLRLGLPDDMLTQAALNFAAILPLELYFVPRFLARLDAEGARRPENPEDGWRERFEERWLKAFGARMLLYLLAGIGLTLFVVPGLFVLLAFGWAPFRVLLRGESLADAMRNSLAIMARAWPQVLRAGLLLLGGYLLLILGLGTGLAQLMPEPSPWQRLTHPALWAGRFLSGLLDLALSTGLLAIYAAVEPVLDEPTGTV